MLSTGINELDYRLGGLAAGRYYLLTGTPGAGKTTACLHFISEGLRADEPCVILTQENPEDLFAQAQFIGHDFEDAVANDKLIVLQYRLDFSTNYGRVANPKVVARELIDALQGVRPTRFVVDSILPFVQAGGLNHGAVEALLHVMDDLQSTCYFTVPGDLGDSFYARLYDPLVSGAAGVLHFEMLQGGVRQLGIRKIRTPPRSTEPLRFVIRSGVGIVEYGDQPVGMIPVESAQSVALVNTGGFIGGDFFAGLQNSYSLVTFASLEEAAPAIVRERFGCVIIAIDPMQPDLAFGFVHNLRKAGDGVPVVLVAASEGLRAATRSRGLRSGADEFITTDASPQEFLSKVETTRTRGPRSQAERLKRETLLVQPRDEAGKPLIIAETELVRVVRHHMQSAEHPFFAIVRLTPAPGTRDQTWQALADCLRLGDGDLIANTSGGNLVLYLHDISRRHVKELMDRIFDADPRLTAPSSMDLLSYPGDAVRISQWINSPEAGEPLRAHG